MAKKVYNSDGKIVFSKFDFKSAETSAGTPNKKQQLDPKAALNRLQKEKEKIKSLAEKGKVTLRVVVNLVPDFGVFFSS